jgi:hypothetical protein
MELLTGGLPLRRLGAWAVLAAVALGAGCDYFKPAVPEPPEQGSAFVPAYDDPNTTVKTMAQALQERRQQGAYVDALAESLKATDQPFMARMDPADVAEQPPGTPIPLRWDRDLERNFYTYLIGLPRDTVFFVAFTAYDADSGGADQSEGALQLLRRRYIVYSGTSRGDTAARGRAELRFIKYNNKWLLLHWLDLRDDDPTANPDIPTFGWLRLRSQ